MVSNSALHINVGSRPLQENNIPAALLGGGYSSDRQMPTKFKCLKDGTIVRSEGSKSVIQMSDSIQFSEVTQELNNALASSFEVGFFTNSFVDNYARYIKTASYSSAFYFYESVQLPTFTWQPPGYGVEVLTEYGSDVYYNSLENFREFCGDQYFQEFN